MGNPEPASSDAARVRGMVLASELPLPGEHEVDEALVAAAAAHLNRTITGRSLELACEIGKYVLEVFFAGDLARFRERGRKHRSFQALAEHGGLQYSAIWLWRAVGIHEQLSLLPPDVASALPYTHHTLLLSLERPDEKVEVGQRAVSGGWTRNQLQAEVTRRRASGRRGRPPIPPLVKALHRIETLLPVAVRRDHPQAALPGRRDLPALLTTDWYRPQWPATLTTTVHDDQTSGPASTEVSLTESTWDTHGNPTLQRHSSPTRPEDKVEVRTTWSSNTAKGLHRPLTVETWSANVDTPATLELVEKATLTYDAGALTAGLLATQTVCAGTVGNLCGESLVWSFTRTPRGAVSFVNGPLQRDVTYLDFAFGDAVPRTTRNALLHEESVELDALGRVVTQVDPNGVEVTIVRDALGRETERWIRGVGAAVGYLAVSTTWHDDAPRWRSEVTHQYDPATGVETGTSEVRTVLDGFGREVQTWTSSPVGWVAQEVEQDPTGAERLRSEPHVEVVTASFPQQLSATRGPRRWYSRVDAGGEVVQTWDLDAGTATIDHPTAVDTRTLLADNYERREVVDTLGRLRTVQQGFTNAAVTVATYKWDGRDRVKQYADGEGNAHRYTFDGAGRVRTVQRRPDPGAGWSTYYSFQWTGPDPWKMWEGAATGTAKSTWTYDALGRTVSKVVTDPLTTNVPAQVTYTWAWDALPGGAPGTGWIGARHQVTDPVGNTTSTYGASGVLGRLGHETGSTRGTYSATPTPYLINATFQRSTDLQGRVLSETWPSGRVQTGQVDGWTLARPAQPTWVSADEHVHSSTQLSSRGWTDGTFRGATHGAAGRDVAAAGALAAPGPDEREPAEPGGLLGGLCGRRQQRVP
jgi:YD repeat-containing protein